MLIENLPYQPFTPPGADFHARWNLRGEFNHILVQERDARLETDRHRRPIHFLQNVIGEITQRICKCHAIERIDRDRYLAHLVRRPVGALLALQDRLRRIAVDRTKQSVHVVERRRADDAR